MHAELIHALSLGCVDRQKLRPVSAFAQRSSSAVDNRSFHGGGAFECCGFGHEVGSTKRSGARGEDLSEHPRLLDIIYIIGHCMTERSLLDSPLQPPHYLCP